MTLNVPIYRGYKTKYLSKQNTLNISHNLYRVKLNVVSVFEGTSRRLKGIRDDVVDREGCQIRVFIKVTCIWSQYCRYDSVSTYPKMEGINQL
jgi:hypothetical protein